MEKSKGINSNSHLPRRKIFAIPLKYFALVGINKNLALQPYPLDDKIFMGLLIYGLCVYSIIVHVIYDAHSFNEYTQSMFALNFMAAVCSCFLILIFNIEIMFEYISICGQLVHTSESNSRNTYRCFHFYRWFLTAFSIQIFRTEIDLQTGNSSRT